MVARPVPDRGLVPPYRWSPPCFRYTLLQSVRDRQRKGIIPASHATLVTYDDCRDTDGSGIVFFLGYGESSGFPFETRIGKEPTPSLMANLRYRSGPVHHARKRKLRQPDDHMGQMTHGFASCPHEQFAFIGFERTEAER